MEKAQLKISLKIGLYHNNNKLDYIFVVISYFSLWSNKCLSIS